MGCAQGKPLRNSPYSGVLEKLKMENGYVGKEGIAGHRRSTGQRHSGKLNRTELQTGKINGSFGSSGGGSSGGSGQRDGGGNCTQKGVQGCEGEVVDGWPKWLIENVPREVLAGLTPKSAESYDKLDKVGQGTYSNVYKARDRDTGKIVALKKVRFDTSEPESVKFMAREIMILQKLDHPNVLKLEGLATSRMQYSLYLVFDFMKSDLARIISRPEGRLTEPQVKCYMLQLLSGLQHCHGRGILHRDIKGSNLLIDRNGMLKIADFGLANYYSPKPKHALTNRVVTLWYRAPELLLGSTDYGVGIDLWSAGCLLAEMFAGRPIMPGKTEVEQLHRIFKLCGTPSEEYWKKLRLSTTFRPPKLYRPSLMEAFKEFPESSLGLLSTLLALDPAYRGCALSALQNEFFYTSPLACDLSGLPVIQQEDDELVQTNKQRKHKHSRMKQRSHMCRQHKRKGQVAEKPKEDSADSREESEKTTEPEQSVNSQDPSSGTSSVSSGAKLSRRVDSPAFMLSPVVSTPRKMTPRSQDHPNASKNIKKLPPLPTSKPHTAKFNNDDSMYRLSQVQRSTSTRDFRKFNDRKHLQLYAADD